MPITPVGLVTSIGGSSQSLIRPKRPGAEPVGPDVLRNVGSVGLSFAGSHGSVSLGATSKATFPKSTVPKSHHIPREVEKTSTLSGVGLKTSKPTSTKIVCEQMRAPMQKQMLTSTWPVKKRKVLEMTPHSQEEHSEGMWLHRSHCIPSERMNGWVVSWVLESYLNEDMVTKACEKASLPKRLEECGLQTLTDNTSGPRKRCQILQQAKEWRSELLDEVGQRNMLASTSESLRSYMSGIRCWAAFNDALGEHIHFPATEERVIKWAAVFTSGATC